MATDRMMLTRPFYLATADVDWVVDIGGGPVAKSCTVATYPCIAALMYEMERLLDTLDTFSVTMDSTGKLVFTRTGVGGNWHLDSMDTRLRKILGLETTNAIFTGGAAAYTADYTPLYCWLPDTISRTDRERWAHVPTVAATEMLTGAVSATTTGDLKYAIEVSVDLEPRYMLYRSAGRTEAEKDRSLDTFVWGYGTTVTTGVAVAFPGDTGEPPADGFYFWPDFSAIDSTYDDSMNKGDAESFELTTSPSTYAWCQFDERYLKRVARRAHSIPVRRDYYGDSLPIHTVSDVPTWGALP